jgi:putative endonuclease
MVSLGYVPVASQYHSRYGEIDLIVQNERYLVFVEVKLRRDAQFAEAREFVSKSKQRKLRMTAQMYLVAHETKLQPRFDVVEIYARDGVKTKNPIVNVLENAF